MRFWESDSEVNDLLEHIAAVEFALSSESDTDRQGDLLDRLSDLYEALEVTDDGNREHEAKAVLSGLGFKQDDFLRPMGEFSGGWVMRAGLAKMLLRNPDLLLLDEPTNHLDLDANVWFEKYLSRVFGRCDRHVSRPRFF